MPRQKVDKIKYSVTFPKAWYEANKEKIYRALEKRGYKSLSEYVLDKIKELVEGGEDE